MTPLPIPTPFDIIPPASGPLIPSTVAWILLAVLGAGGAWLASRARNQGTGNSLRAVLESLAKDLDHAARELSTGEVERVTRVARRIISHYVPNDLSGFTSAEIRTLAHERAENADEMFLSTSAILHIIADLEELAYAPKRNAIAREASELATRLSRMINLHLRRHPPV